ncbi:MAG: hypothetical protein L0241_30420 [Planctomycetia bacterium]|nr:hypothetical protein [Planctomycetia bacterium]
MVSPDLLAALNEIAANIHQRYRSHLRELQITAVVGGVILSGRSSSYYGKQMAQHEVLRHGLTIVANSITVLHCAAATSGAEPFE